MAPAPTPSSSTAKPRLPPKSAAGTTPATGRVTRLRAAKEASTTPSTPAVPRQPGLLAMGKEGLRKVSGKNGQKEKPTPALRTKPDGAASQAPAETLKAFLRIRPPPAAASDARPYLEIQSTTDVLMRAPIENSRHHVPKPPHLFSFDQVFPPDTPQSDFFTTTTLPLVDKLLAGENGLMFTYGVSNSGKSYTIQGGSTMEAEQRGVLPRAIDVVFNSIEGLESSAKLQTQGLADVVFRDNDEYLNIVDPLATQEPKIPDTIKVDRNFSYAIFVSYSEVYNEKIFDLLDSVLPTSPATPTQPRPRATYDKAPRGSRMQSFSAVNSSFHMAAMANGGGGVLKRQALSLKNDPEGSGKYIAGLKDVRVRTREEALAVFRSGQNARQVFGTLANRESSRSHGIFTIKVVRIHNGAPLDPDSAQVSRLAIVDLAGSERNKNTHTTGDRLKEAGNINKSLMVLGQCLEVLRANQQKLAGPGPAAKKRIAVVPFRHSKLTEIFQNFFVGDGRAVIVINVNPFDTGFDENSHVMRFSASAREVQTTAHNKVTVPVIPKDEGSRSAGDGGKGKAAKEGDGWGKMTADRESQGFVMVEEELEVEEQDPESEDEDEKDALVEYLFEQLQEMKTRLYESEMRSAAIEVEVREEVAREMQESMQRMHEGFTQRFNEHALASELKADRKIDIVMRSMTPAVSRTYRNIPEHSPADVTMEEEDRSFESAIDESLMASGDDSMVTSNSDPFLAKAPTIPIPTVTISRDSVPAHAREAGATDKERNGDLVGSEEQYDEEEGEESGDEGDDVDEDEESEEEEEDEGLEDEEDDSDGSAFTISANEASDAESDQELSPPRQSSASPRKSKQTPAKKRAPSTYPLVARESSSTPQTITPGPLAERVSQLELSDDDDDEVPVKSTKKKRTLGKKKVVTEDEMERHDLRISGAEVKRMMKASK
ncbi:kinesin family member 20/23 [Cryptococcus wingfieldii CBS 7118]|uniref:Kinesin-like protein n=1 Tax=Cryptococcus wingfieldii CBS 7118 TaxID=1295528 RepID=A0A1E3HGZ3_9TREE|nr:kinesin family member 20/23 [Cryptococcus wingfieldii CBS 7118]ODN75618.1 kinesin family member 20/23 [Cryptococcus wingfieldii CBS 7118]